MLECVKEPQIFLTLFSVIRHFTLGGGAPTTVYETAHGIPVTMGAGGARAVTWAG